MVDTCARQSNDAIGAECTLQRVLKATRQLSSVRSLSRNACLLNSSACVCSIVVGADVYHTRGIRTRTMTVRWRRGARRGAPVSMVVNSLQERQQSAVRQQHATCTVRRVWCASRMGTVQRGKKCRMLKRKLPCTLRPAALPAWRARKVRDPIAPADDVEGRLQGCGGDGRWPCIPWRLLAGKDLPSTAVGIDTKRPMPKGNGLRMRVGLQLSGRRWLH